MNYIKDLIDRIQDNADYLSALWDDVEISETPSEIIQLRECLLKEENDIDL